MERENVYVIPDGVVEVTDRCVDKSQNFTKVVFPDSVKMIEGSAFSECVSLEEVVIQGEPEIGSRAFSGCSKLRSVVFQGEAIKLDCMAFEKCSSLKEIKMTDGSEVSNIGSLCSSVTFSSQPTKPVTSF